MTFATFVAADDNVERDEFLWVSSLRLSMEVVIGSGVGGIVSISGQ